MQHRITPAHRLPHAARIPNVTGADLDGTAGHENRRTADACRGIDWTREAIAAQIKRTVAEHKLKMPQFGIPARVLVFGRTQTPALEAVLALMPRETVIHRLAAGLAHAL